jgi:imidazolonepropionase-like amidohydrolase
MAAEPPTATLFQDVRVFDGRTGGLSAPSHVLVEGPTITRVSAAPVTVDAGRPVTVVAGDGRVLMPGLIDAHWHAMFAAMPLALATSADVGYLNLLAGRQAEATLMRGFTTVRDMGGPVFGLKRAIDDGIIAGPRIYPSGAFISQTAGHGDFRMPYEVPRAPGAPLSYTEQIGVAAIADSPDEVRLRAREQLRQGASQLKLMAGGGVASPFDPLDVTQYTEPELRSAVEAAENWGTYVAVHVYTPRAIRVAVAAGVKCIDHGHLIDEPTVELLAQQGVWLSLQPFLDDEDATTALDEAGRQKLLQVTSGTDTAYTLANQHGLKVAFGTDILFDARLATRQGAQLGKVVRWYSAADVLKMATADNAELLALSGPRNPYPGALGVVQEGALADLLLVDGDPLENIELLAEPASKLLVIMKNGQIYKNLLDRSSLQQ